jgi:hypothetical protein
MGSTARPERQAACGLPFGGSGVGRGHVILPQVGRA